MKTGPETAVVSATTNSISLRTTIPLFVVKQLNLTDGDCVDWKLDEEGKPWLAKITKKAVRS